MPPRQRRPRTASVYNDLITCTAQILGKKLFRRPAIMSTAMAIAQNHPETRSEKTLFVDVSELSQRDANTGVQRVTRSILKQLLEKPPAGYVVEPVYGTPERPGYRYAKKFTQNFLQLDQAVPEERFIDVRRGDIFFGLDLQHHVVTRNQDYYAHLRNLGSEGLFSGPRSAADPISALFSRRRPLTSTSGGYRSSRSLTALFACRAQWPISTSTGLHKAACRGCGRSQSAGRIMGPTWNSVPTRRASQSLSSGTDRARQRSEFSDGRHRRAAQGPRPSPRRF